ncbi:hypothetical protein VTL71DRAFT_2836 [Oculimacula yallundae]|uniref:Uncharacterized protein n=1 Tax=Oculimacula yallundae TaxID=86028 RepID=A0ABR4CA61_9HELO
MMRNPRFAPCLVCCCIARIIHINYNNLSVSVALDQTRKLGSHESTSDMPNKCQLPIFGRAADGYGAYVLAYLDDDNIIFFRTIVVFTQDWPGLGKPDLNEINYICYQNLDGS